MDNTISCGRASLCNRKNGKRGSKVKSTVAHIGCTADTAASKKEKTASAVMLFGAVICMLCLCHFSDSRALSTDDDSGASSLYSYEAVEVFGELGTDASTFSEISLQNDDGWTFSGYFKEFMSALLGV